MPHFDVVELQVLRSDEPSPNVTLKPHSFAEQPALMVKHLLISHDIHRRLHRSRNSLFLPLVAVSQ
jgi:hypothetical protein